MKTRPLSVVAIDGPAGAGKSTVARRVAARLNYAFLDTGAMYRAATWRALHHEIPLDDTPNLVKSTREMRLEFRNGRVFVDDTDVSDAIRTPEVTRSIRALDSLPGVREHLGRLQRELGASRPTVAEGRDMGTVIFPDAICKVFLDATIDERARRRANEFSGAAESADIELVKAEIEARDSNDRKRETAPLRAAPDAHRLDTTTMTIDEVVDAIVELVREATSDG